MNIPVEARKRWEGIKKELKSLQKTGDHYPKYIITLDMDLESDYKINVIDWLLTK